MANQKRRKFTPEFKAQIVQLYLSGKPRKDIIAEYDLTPSSMDKWLSQYSKSGSFKEKDNKSEEQLELEYLRKENQRYKMEIDILKQAALIMGRK